MKKFIFITLLLFNINAQSEENLRFTLHEKTIGEVTEKNWSDKYLYIAIGYISCPDICPTTLLDMTEVIDNLGEDTDKIIPIFISIDPKRDTPEKLYDYVNYFSPKIKGLVGNHEQTQAVAERLRATYGYQLDGTPIEPPLPERYEVYHSTYNYLYSPKRELVDVFGYGTAGKDVAQQIKELIP
ncbi:MAG: SCO family protein [Alphaproteobacteria bacterium]